MVGLHLALEVRQQEIVLAKLPVPEAHAYYQTLRRRAWRTRALRLVAVLALITLAYVARRRMLPGAGEVRVGYLTQRTYASGKLFQSPVAPAFQPVKPSQ